MRAIAEVTTAVARGDLTKRITVDVRGEILELKMTVNDMTRSLSIFAAEVTRLAFRTPVNFPVAKLLIAGVWTVGWPAKLGQKGG